MNAHVAAQITAARAQQPGKAAPGCAQGGQSAQVPVPLASVAPRARKSPRHLEDDLQRGCVAWFRYQYAALAPLLFAIPNGGQRNAREGARLKAQGVTSGVADLLLAVQGQAAPGLFIELKVGPNKPSAAQLAHLELLKGQGFGVAVIYSLEAFQSAIRFHLARP